MVAVGDGNTQSLVQGRYEPLLRSLGALEREIRESALSDERKVSAIADIQTIEFQLAKPAVNHSIVKEAWRGVEVAVTAGHAVELIAKVGELLSPLLAGATALHP